MKKKTCFRKSQPIQSDEAAQKLNGLNGDGEINEKENFDVLMAPPRPGNCYFSFNRFSLFWAHFCSFLVLTESELIKIVCPMFNFQLVLFNLIFCNSFHYLFSSEILLS